MFVLKFIGICIEVLLLFNVLIFVHELGHFLAARWRGLVVEEFALWFGKPLWRKKIGGVWYAINSIPAGGYVKLPQMANGDVEGSTEFKAEDLPKVRPIDKIIVAAAGPLFSFLLAVAFAVIVATIGHPLREEAGTTTVGFVQKDSPAEKAGFQVGDKILSVDGVPVTRWGGQGNDCIQWRIVRSEGETVSILVERGGQNVTLNPAPTRPEKTVFTRRKTREVGIAPASTPLVNKIEPGSTADKAGMRPRDLITHINDRPLFGIEGIGSYVDANPAESYTLTVERAGAMVKVPFTPGRPKIGRVEPDSPAARAGLQQNDVIISADGQAVKTSNGLLKHIRSKGKEPIQFVVERKGAAIPPITVTPADAKVENAPARPRIGVAFEDPLGIEFDPYGRGQLRKPGVWEQITQAATSIFNTVDAVTSSKSDISIQHLGGPVMMMRIYYILFEQEDGWKLALWFSVVLNVNLALMNLLPIPPLDGSHIVFSSIAALRRKPDAADAMMNSKPVQWFVTAGTLLVMGFMVYITFFDVQDVFRGEGGSDKFEYANPADAKPPEKK